MNKILLTLTIVFSGSIIQSKTSRVSCKKSSSKCQSIVLRDFVSSVFVIFVSVIIWTNSCGLAGAAEEDTTLFRFVFLMNVLTSVIRLDHF